MSINENGKLGGIHIISNKIFIPTPIRVGFLLHSLDYILIGTIIPVTTWINTFLLHL
jgi:hypothetical protein